MKSSLMAVVLLAMAGLPALGGCAVDSDDTSEDAADAVRSRQQSFLGDVKAVRLYGANKVTLAAPKKVSAILENVGLAPGAKKPTAGALRCLPRYSLEFLDAEGAVLGTAGFVCGPGQRKDAGGSVIVKGKSYLVTAADLDAIDAIGVEPLAVADYLFGADKVKIEDVMNPRKNVESTDPADIGKLVNAMQGDDVPDPKARFSRCIPAANIVFTVGDKTVASATPDCGAGATGTVTAKFADATKLVGGVKIDAGAVFDLQKALQDR